MSHDARQTGPALEAMYCFTLWLIPTLEKFPRSQRSLLGGRPRAWATAGGQPVPNREVRSVPVGAAPRRD